jgi:hypothetical protein
MIIIDFFFLIHSFVEQTLIIRAISKRLSGESKPQKNQVRVSDKGVSLLRNQKQPRSSSPTKKQKAEEQKEKQILLRAETIP